MTASTKNATPCASTTENLLHVLCGYRDQELVHGVYGPEPYAGKDGAVRFKVKEIPVPDGRGNLDWSGRLITQAERQGQVACAWEAAGQAWSAAGKKQMPGPVMLPAGGKFSVQLLQAVLLRLAEKGFDTDNVVFTTADKVKGKADQ